MIEYLCGVCYDIDMIIGNGIESIWINCLFLYNNFNVFLVVGKVLVVEVDVVVCSGFDIVF